VDKRVGLTRVAGDIAEITVDLADGPENACQGALTPTGPPNFEVCVGLFGRFRRVICLNAEMIMGDHDDHSANGSLAAIRGFQNFGLAST
jgi:hypothetical protein